MKILDPREAVEYLLDPARSGPVLSLDTEFDNQGGSVPTCRATITGLSMAGGTPETGFQGAFWSFRPGRATVDWRYLLDRVLLPVFGDPARTVVMHPPKVDMQILRARGVTEDRVRAQIECTMSQVHVYDENLPKALKELGRYLLHLDVVTHAEMQAKMKALSKEGDKLAKETLRDAWNCYAEFRKPKGSPEQAVIDAAWPSWQRLVMSFPSRLTKGDVVERLGCIREVIAADFETRAHNEFATYGAYDALITLAVRYFLKAETPPAFEDYVRRETAVCHPVVTEIEERGLRIDVDRLRVIHDAMQTAVSAIRAEVMARWGVSDGVAVDDEGEFNPGSPEQVQHKLWIEWGLRPPPWAQKDGEIKPKFRKGKQGLCSSGKDILAWLADNAAEPHRTAVARLIDLRKYEKLLSSFVVPILDRATRDPETRIHASFWPVGARTGRFSSDEPNVENIPRPSSMPRIAIPQGADPEKPMPGFVVWRNKKTKAVEKWQVDSLRQVFVAPTGFKLVSVDLSQIENRLIAHESQDPTLLWLYRSWDCADCKATGETDEPLHACPKCGAKEGKRDKLHADQPALKGFCLGRDIHAYTALRAGYVEKFGAEEGRERGKTLNHAFNYGMGAATKARRDGETVKEAQIALDAMRTSYARVARLHETTKGEVRDNGFVAMFNGQRRRFYVARLLQMSGNFHDWEWEGVIREAVNVKAQGGTGVIVKEGMIRMRARFRELAKTDPRFREVRIVNQVHDEVVLEAPEEIAEQVKDIARDCLERAFKLSVPIIADGRTGKTWGEAH